MTPQTIAMMAQRWPRWIGRNALLREWSSVGVLTYVLADIALRGNVYTPINAASDREAFIAEGRRQLALEIIEQAKISPDKIYALLEQAAPTERKLT